MTIQNSQLSTDFRKKKINLLMKQGRYKHEHIYLLIWDWSNYFSSIVSVMTKSLYPRHFKLNVLHLSGKYHSLGGNVKSITEHKYLTLLVISHLWTMVYLIVMRHSTPSSNSPQGVRKEQSYWGNKKNPHVYESRII